jgi:mannose-1-phosphate guanylyltransferase
MDYGVIMAGGSGTRLWPLSREKLPKQLLRVIGGKSLLRVSFERLLGMFPADRIYVCTLEQHRALVLAELPEMPAENLIGEPMGRDTAAGVGISAAVLAQRDPEARFAVVTADHVIEPVADFQACLKRGFNAVEKYPGVLVTFGITPTFGHTGLGYVQRGGTLGGGTEAFRVKAFREKPDQVTADAYVASGEYLWNSGMFVWRARTFMDRLREYLPKTCEALLEIAKDYDGPNRKQTLDRLYPTLQKISVDFAIMEPASLRAPASDAPSGVVVVEMPVNWLDVGSWPALSETLPTDAQKNASTNTSFVALSSRGNVLVQPDDGHVIALIGVDDLVVVRTPDATLICPKDQAQRVKDAVSEVKKRFGESYL